MQIRSARWEKWNAATWQEKFGKMSTIFFFYKKKLKFWSVSKQKYFSSSPFILNIKRLIAEREMSQFTPSYLQKNTKKLYTMILL